MATSGLISTSAGDTEPLFVVATRGDGITPVDLTTATLIFTVTQVGGGIVLQKTTPNGISITDAVNGKATVNILPADTKGLVGNYLFDLVLIEANANRRTLNSGSFVVADHPNKG